MGVNSNGTNQIQHHLPETPIPRPGTSEAAPLSPNPNNSTTTSGSSSTQLSHNSLSATSILTAQLLRNSNSTTQLRGSGSVTTLKAITESANESDDAVASNSTVSGTASSTSPTAATATRKASLSHSIGGRINQYITAATSTPATTTTTAISSDSNKDKQLSEKTQAKDAVNNDNTSKNLNNMSQSSVKDREVSPAPAGPTATAAVTDDITADVYNEYVNSINSSYSFNSYNKSTAAAAASSSSSHVSSVPVDPTRENPFQLSPHDFIHLKSLRLEIVSTWGDDAYVGLTGLELLTGYECKRMTGLLSPHLRTNPVDLSVLGFFDDPRVPTNLLNSINNTTEGNHIHHLNDILVPVLLIAFYYF